MKPFDDLLERAKSNPRHIVLAEGEDPRVVEGGVRARREGVARVTLLGRVAQVRRLLRGQGGEDLPVAVVDPATSPDL